VRARGPSFWKSSASSASNQPTANTRSSATTSKVATSGTGRLRFLEVKGRVSGAATITVTKNEILYSLNKPEDFILAIVEFLDGDTHRRALRAAALPA
jgi:hypothetical protein